MRRLIGPALGTLAMLAVLVGLGTWQIERMAWKHAILAAIAAAEAAPAIPLPADPPPFARVRVDGVLHGDPAVRYGVDGRDRPEGQVLGTQLIVPLERPGAEPVLVMLGWVPDRPGTVGPTGPASIEGYVRQPERPGWFTPADDLATRRFFALDPAKIGAALGLPHVAPFILVALGPPGPALPEPAHALPRPVDNHLSYALTWYGLALVLLVIFFLHARKVLRP